MRRGEKRDIQPKALLTFAAGKDSSFLLEKHGTCDNTWKEKCDCNCTDEGKKKKRAADDFGIKVRESKNLSRFASQEKGKMNQRFLMG